MNQLTYKPCRDDEKNRRCSDWSDCRGHAFYTPQEITYCRYQIQWLIYNLVGYRDGHYYTEADTWPSEQRDSGYDNTPIQHSVRATAGFQKIREITGDVISRLERTGKDGQILYLECRAAGDIVQFSQDARNALHYISGWKRKRLSFGAWLKQRNYLHKVTTKR